MMSWSLLSAPGMTRSRESMTMSLTASTAGLERLVSPDPAEALALFDQVQPT